MVEKGAPGGGQFDAVDAAVQELNADLVFQITDLATERRLRRMQPFFSRDREASSLGDRDEIAEVPQLHSSSHIFKALRPNLQSLFPRR